MQQISDSTYDRVWQVIADVRDAYPRDEHDALTDEIVEALIVAGLICEQPD